MSDRGAKLACKINLPGDERLDPGMPGQGKVSGLWLSAIYCVHYSTGNWYQVLY